MSRSAVPVGVTYDSGMLIAFDRGDRVSLARHAALVRAGQMPTVPAGVLAQVWRSDRQVPLARALRACEVEPLTDDRARAVGRLAAATGHHDVVDLSVVEGALRRGHRVATSDPQGLLRAGLPASHVVRV